MIEHLIKVATCRVSCGTESGTGWLIGRDRVLTARHCILSYLEKGHAIQLYFSNPGENPVAGEIVAQSEDWDICLLSLSSAPIAEPLPVSVELPQEGEAWQTFGYPGGKTVIGHRLTGTIAQTLDVPIQKIDIDLSIDPSTALQAYKGLSGGPVVCCGVAVGIITKKLDGTIAALSLHVLKEFLTDNGVVEPNKPSSLLRPLLAAREDFSKTFAEAVIGRGGRYLFLEGAHGYGKSTFCRHFQTDEKKLVILGAYCLSDPESALGANYRAQPQVFLDWLITKISGLITGKPPQKEEQSYPEQIRKTSEYLSKFSKYCEQSRRQGILFIDGLNEISVGATLDTLIGMLPDKLPANVSVALTSPNFINIAAALAGKVKKDDVFELPPLSYFACYSYCQRALTPERRSPAFVVRICEKAKGHPLYLRYLVKYANIQATDDDLDDFQVLTGPIEEYYRGIWTKLLLDGDAVNLLALMARLRWGISKVDFAKILNPSEQAQFVSVISRIRHLLADDKSTAIYHASFATFIIEQTADINEPAYRRLAKFCRKEPSVRYCALNLIFHLFCADDNTVFVECNQTWFDTAVRLGVEPDALIADIDAVVKRAAIKASPDEFFRLTLLAQRVIFRYDTLFAQSARLIAEALIALDRPNEALQHIVRLKTLIVNSTEAFEIAFLLHIHGYNKDALRLLENIEHRIIEYYHHPATLLQFLSYCCLHLKNTLLIGLVTDRSKIDQLISITNFAKDACATEFEDEPDKISHCIQHVRAVPTAHFLAFCDKYTSLSEIKQMIGDDANFSDWMPLLCLALLNYEGEVDTLNLPKRKNSLGKLFADFAELVYSSNIDSHIADAVADTLIRFGAPAGLVEQFAAKGCKQLIQPLQIRTENGVDVNYKDLHKCLSTWRVAAFLDRSFRGALSGIITGPSWLESLQHLIGALYCCDGRARRAKADSDEPLLNTCINQLRTQVMEPLRFTLQQRVTWSDSYAIPENALPEVYRQLTELLFDCFPEELSEWLDNLLATADGQWGMYSEGFRASACQILKQLTREKPSEALAPKLLTLLHAWRDHVLRGVENRHELVPEILRMITAYAQFGAKEEAERLYQRLLSVSMGPTWYKEDQLSIMTEVIGSVTPIKDISQRLPLIAGYLEKGSGEMTFQRYVQQRKSNLIGEMARHGKHHVALAYFRRQCCGSTEELWNEAQHGPIDKVGPMKGNRFPGGALDDQAAILALVQNSGTVLWALRWSLLEIFHCGDSRHLTDYARAFGKIANEVGALPELVHRTEIVANAETPNREKTSFLQAFKNELKPELHASFAVLFESIAPVVPPKSVEPTSRNKRDDDERDSISGLFHPGIFGHTKALRDADKILEEAENQWALGNYNAAKSLAVKVLQTAQQGGWGIWGNLSSGARRAEKMLAQDEMSAANVIRYYAPLIEAEKYVQKWIPAQHIIEKVGPLLSDLESQRLLDAVIDHCRLVVGEAAQEIQTFAFLNDDTLDTSTDVEYFRFIVWLCDHPKWLRRDRAAAMLLWIVEQVPDFFSEAVTTAFSMKDGYGPDVLCGVLDGASARNPASIWDRVANALDLTKVTHELSHISRMVVLERLATRGDKASSSSAKAALAQIKASFTGKCGTVGTPELPIWADRLERQWQQILHLLSLESGTRWQREMERLCSPLGVTDALALETAVAISFREGHNRPYDRWESKLRHSLNVALWSQMSREGAIELEAAFRIYNPSQPERTVRATNNPVTDQLLNAITSGEYSTALGSNETTLLHFHDFTEKPTKDGVMHIEVLCQLQPIANRIGFFGSQHNQSFSSSELPVASTLMNPFETCCRLNPKVVFFDSFTPATPLPFFQNLVGASDEEFIRQNWRYGRRNEDRGFGLPERTGCSLSISRNALKIPPGFKLTWIVLLDGKVATVIDERDNRMV